MATASAPPKTYHLHRAIIAARLRIRSRAKYRRPGNPDFSSRRELVRSFPRLYRTLAVYEWALDTPTMEVAVAHNEDSPIYEFPVKTLDGRRTTLGEFRGKVMLIVNVASQCGFTPQYEGLEALYRKYKDRGLVVLGFPCNQFGGQEPGNEDEIRQFCKGKYDITFPLFSKLDVNGKNADPLYVWLKSQKKGILGTESIKWNFTKFLVNSKGEVLDRYGSNVTPKELDTIVDGALQSTA